MFAVIRISYLYLESLSNASFDQNKWGIGFMCSDKKELDRNAVRKEEGLSG